MTIRQSRWPPLAWALYDFGNSAFALLISGVGFQLYFKQVALAERTQSADFLWGAVVGSSILLSAFLSPVIGAFSDRRGARREVLRWLTIMAVAATAGLALVGPNQTTRAIVLFFAANCIYNLALIVYDSLLPMFAPAEATNRVSGMGWGLGYAGGLVCLGLTYSIFSRPADEAADAYRLGFIVVAAFFLIFSIPLLWLTRPAVVTTSRDAETIRGAVSQVVRTAKGWREHSQVFRFILAYYFISEAILTSIYFTANYLSTTFKMPNSRVIMLTVLLQVIGFPATWIFGVLADRWDSRRAMIASLVVWIVVVVIFMSAASTVLVYLAIGLMGLVIGSTQAIGRAYLASLAPTDRVSEFFGFNSLSSKVAATLGPVLFGAISSATGNQRLGWLAVLPFLIVGLILIARPASMGAAT